MQRRTPCVSALFFEAGLQQPLLAQNLLNSGAQGLVFGLDLVHAQALELAVHLLHHIREDEALGGGDVGDAQAFGAHAL